MNKCNLAYINSIISAVETFFYYEDDKSLVNLENYVKAEVSGLSGDFSLETYMTGSSEFADAFKALIDIYNLPATDYLKNTESIEVKTKSNIAPNLSSTTINDLFHTLPLVKANFQGNVTADIIKEIIVGKGSSDKYVSSNEEISSNLSDLKNRLFKQIQQFLLDKKKLNDKVDKVVDLYNENGDVADYNYYKKVMMLLDQYFFSGENFTLIQTYSNKKGIPNLSMDLQSNSDIFEAYNAGILLANFDTVLQEYFSDIIDINYNLFNNLRTNISGENKYSLKIKGIKTDYWLSDTHAAEGTESSESKLAALLVSTIPIYNKKDEKMGWFMEMKDFYLFAALLSRFEIENGNKLKNAPNSTFMYFNEDSKKALLWYIDEILKAINNEAGNITELKSIFQHNYEFVLSLKHYIESPDFNILEKEKNSQTSLLNMFAQIINNSYGAAYLKYNANGKYQMQEMYNQNFNNIEVQSSVFNYLVSNPNKKKYSTEENSKEISKLFEGIENISDLKNITKQNKIAINSFIRSRSGITLSYLGFDDLINTLKAWAGNKPVNSTYFKNMLTHFISSLESDYKLVSSAVKTDLDKIVRGDATVSEFIPQTTKDAFFKALTSAFLVNTVLKPVMNVEMMTGETLPTFKLATLTQKDAQLFEAQRGFERTPKTADNRTVFRSLLIKDIPAILGTGTKLEGINGDTNKTAVKFNVSENFTSDFQFDFLQNIINNDKFSIMIGNYSDKNTVLTKIINGKFYVESDSNPQNIPVLKLPISNLLELVRTQAGNYYKDTLKKIFRDYEKLLGIKLSKSYEDNINKINRALKNINIRDLSKIASDNGINLTEELHYSSYKNPEWTPENGENGEKEFIFSLNQLIVDNYRIFNDKELFTQFVERQEKSMLDKFRLFNKSVGGGNSISFAGPIDINAALEKLGLSKNDFDVKQDGEKEAIDYTRLEGKQGLNPLLKKWMWANALFRNEYMFISGKGEYMHPHKLKGKLRYRGDVNALKSKDANQREEYWNELDKEMSGRLISMAKRNVMFTATIEVPVRKSKLGVPEKVNMAVIDDHKSMLYNIAGKTKKQDAHDGSSFINYVYSKMLDSSFPGKGYSGTKKEFGTLITEYGVVIKKDAESVITNDRILNSRNSSIKFYDKQKQALGLNIGLINFNFRETFNNEFFFNEAGTQYRIENLTITNNNYKMVVSKLINGQWKTERNLRQGNFNSLFDLWKAFGAEYSTDINENFNEGSNDLLYRIVTTPDANGNFPLKDKMIHIISSASAVKAGGTNVNPSDSWVNDNDLAYFSFENRFMGPQLDASHEANESEIKEVTQVISALAQNPTTAHLAKEAYDDIANVIKNAAAPYLRYLKPGENVRKSDLYKYLSDKFVKTIERSKGDNIAKILVQSFENDINIPFSNQNFFVPFVRDIITRMNNEFITRYYSGTGAVLLPSHGMIQVYDIPQTDGTTRVVTQADLAKEALQWYSTQNREVIPNEQIIKNYIEQLLPPQETTWDKIKLGDIIESLVEFDDVDELGVLPEDVFIEKISKPWNSDPTKSNIAYNFSLNSKPNEIFQLVKDHEPGYYSIHFKTSGKESLTNDEKSRLIYSIYSQLPAGAKLSTYGEITKGGISGLNRFLDYMQKSDEKRIVKLKDTNETVEIPVLEHKKILKSLPITLSTPDLYYQYKANKTNEPVIKVQHIARDLKPSEISYIDNNLERNLFDLDSVRLRFNLSNIVKPENELTPDFTILKNFYNHFTQKDLLSELSIDSEKTKKELSQWLNRWTQRNLDLLNEERIINSVDENTDFSVLFKADTLNETFKDARINYTNDNSHSISNYKFNAAELILGDIYESKFSRDFNDSVYDIKKQGSSYFFNKLEKDFQEDHTIADIKLNLTNLDTPVYIKYVDVLPGNDYKFNITLESPLDDDGVKKKFVRRNQRGEIVYTIPSHEHVRVKSIDGKEVIFIKAAASSKAGKKTIYDKDRQFEKHLNELIGSFRGNIKSFIPLMNSDVLIGNIVNEKGEERSSTQFFNNITLNTFSRYSGYTTTNTSNLSLRWLLTNKEDILNQLSKKMYASWEKSHEFVAARIPSQSMQSFMEMKNIAYLKTRSNDAYVSIWQIWLQGSDFDIDKAYILGSGFNSNGQFETWSPISNYSSLEQLNALERLPIPKGIKSVVSTNENEGVDLSNEIENFFKVSDEELIKILRSEDVLRELDKIYYLKEFSVKQINIINEALRKISKSNILSEQDATTGVITKTTKVKPYGNREDQNIFIAILNRHNLSKSYLKQEHAMKNSIVSRIKQIISAPSNQLLANTPVDIDDWHKAAASALSKKQSKEILLSSYDMFSMYKQQRDASVGKDDVGIAANGLKVFFALSTYYNDYYNTSFIDNIARLRTNFKTFKKEFKFINTENPTEPIIYSLGTIADIDITKEQAKRLSEAIGDYEIFRTNTAIALSGFTSAATDNAKELLMAKVNANVELASMHIYLLILGFTPNQVAEIMTQPIIDEVIEGLEVNMFFDNSSPKVNIILGNLASKYKDDAAKLQNVKTLQDIYQGAQEVKLLAKLLGANQKTSANTEEVNRFLTNFESAIYAREHQIFGETLTDFNTWVNYSDSIDAEKAEDANKKFEKLIDKIFANNIQLNPTEDKEYVESILKSASKIEVSYTDVYGVRKREIVSLLGGKFNFKYYIDPDNKAYRDITKKYYNLIKNTFNIFDIIDNVPHFKEMINGLILSHNLLLNSSAKYNAAFSLVPDTIRKNASRVIDPDSNPTIKNQMGNSALYPMITTRIMQKALMGIDIRLRSEWLKSEGTQDFVFNVTQLLKTFNDENRKLNRESLKEFLIYTSDDARNTDAIQFNSKKITEDDTEDTIISLNTNYGIANFKKVMELILLPLLQTKSNVLLDSFRVQNITNGLGIKSSSITSTFPLSALNNVVARDKSQKLTKAFNDLDVSSETSQMVRNANNKIMKWRDLFYVYNLVVNNEKYGNHRLTPLFEDYIKEKDSLGYDYVMFSSKIDSGELNLFDLQRELNNNPEYISAVKDGDLKTQRELESKVQRELENDILFYALNDKGELSIKGEGNTRNNLKVTNGDFVIVTSLTETPETKRTWVEMNEVIRIIKNRGFIIKFEC